MEFVFHRSRPEAHIIAKANVFINLCHPEPADRPRYLTYYRDREVMPSIDLHPSAFDKYSMDIEGLIHGLGWTGIMETLPSTFCAEAVRLFYANLRIDASSSSSRFSTIVFGHHITLTADLLAEVLEYSTAGRTLGRQSDFPAFKFDISSALNILTRDDCSGQSHVSLELLPDELRVLHFYITRLFLPRSFSLNIVTPMDAWVLFNAILDTRLSLPHLMFATMMEYGNHSHPGKLPFAPQITRLLRLLGLDLKDKASDTLVLADLRAQHVLRKVQSMLGNRRKFGNLSGGDDDDGNFFTAPEDDESEDRDMGGADICRQEGRTKARQDGLHLTNLKEPALPDANSATSATGKGKKKITAEDGDEALKMKDGGSDYEPDPDYDF